MEVRKHAIHGRAQDDQLADADRVEKMQAIHGSGDHGPPGVAHSRHGAGQIDQVHDLAAEDVAQAVGIVGQRQLRVFGVRFANGLSFSIGCRY